MFEISFCGHDLALQQARLDLFAILIWLEMKGY